MADEAQPQPDAPEWKRAGLIKGIGLPAPSGQHRVGCVDVMPLCPGEEKGLLFRLYYPTRGDPTEATPDSGYQYAPWLPNKIYAKGYMVYKKHSSLVAGALGTLFDTFCRQSIPALYGAPVMRTSSSLPVVMFSHGVAGMRTTYSAVCCDLASHGYLVAAIEHRDGSSGYSFTKYKKDNSEDNQEFVDEWIPFDRPPSSFAEEHIFRAKQLVLRRKEIAIGLDFIHGLNETGGFYNLLQSDFDFKQFKDNLDMEHIAIMGHSFGAATTVTALADDKRFKVGLALDAYMMPVADGIETSVEQPLLFINTWTWQWPKNIVKIKALVDSKKIGDNYSNRQLITLRETNHEDQTDISFVIPGLRRSPVSPSFNTIHATNMTLCHAFLRRHLWQDTTWPVRDLDESDTDSSGIVLHGTNVKIESKV